MVSILKTDRLERLDSKPVQLTGQNAPKLWANFGGSGTVTMRESLNISSVVDEGAGQYLLNFTNAMKDTNYGPYFAAGGGVLTSDATVWLRSSGNTYAGGVTVNFIKIASGSGSTGSYGDVEYVGVAALGDLA